MSRISFPSLHTLKNPGTTAQKFLGTHLRPETLEDISKRFKLTCKGPPPESELKSTPPLSGKEGMCLFATTTWTTLQNAKNLSLAVPGVAVDYLLGSDVCNIKTIETNGTLQKINATLVHYGLVPLVCSFPIAVLVGGLIGLRNGDSKAAIKTYFIRIASFSQQIGSLLGALCKAPICLVAMTLFLVPAVCHGRGAVYSDAKKSELASKDFLCSSKGNSRDIRSLVNNAWNNAHILDVLSSIDGVGQTVSIPKIILHPEKAKTLPDTESSGKPLSPKGNHIDIVPNDIILQTPSSVPIRPHVTNISHSKAEIVSLNEIKIEELTSEVEMPPTVETDSTPAPPPPTRPLPDIPSDSTSYSPPLPLKIPGVGRGIPVQAI